MFEMSEMTSKDLWAHARASDYYEHWRMALKKAASLIDKLTAENNSRQRSIEILGKAIGEVLPNFRASGTGEEHSAACAKALLVVIKNLTAENKAQALQINRLQRGDTIESDYITVREEKLLSELWQLKKAIRNNR